MDAAAAEFAERGIAGARVDRVVAAARSNKAQLYQYFGSKDQLFDAVFERHMDWLISSVPLDGCDLAGYAVDLYNACLEQPELVRLAAWTRLERRPVGALLAGDRDAANVAAIAAAQASGDIDPATDATDVLSIVTAMALSWSPASLQIAASTVDPARTHARRRNALAAAVQGAFSAKHSGRESISR